MDNVFVKTRRGNQLEPTGARSVEVCAFQVIMLTSPRRGSGYD